MWIFILNVWKFIYIHIRMNIIYTLGIRLIKIYKSCDIIDIYKLKYQTLITNIVSQLYQYSKLLTYQNTKFKKKNLLILKI